MLNKFSLEGKVAIVTGSSRGLGQGMAKGLAEAGAHIVGVDYTNQSDETKEIIEGLGRKYLHIQADLMSIDKLDFIVEESVKTFGHIDILVNNAGIIRREDAINFTEKDWDDVMDINVKTVFFFSQAVAKQFMKQGTGGNIVNIASMLSFQGGIRVPSYTASKSGVMGITRLMANEWAKDNINVNAIAPGYMATDNTTALRADEKRNAEILGRIPAARWGDPEDLSGPVVFLASDAASYVNGYTLAVDGGWLAR
ncbi:2-dehydro-3-deoxy-D-gluconate 5-dehydrogenase KduD [Acidaminobacter sp. JC074]|uniref:2-dehydro-3-deoxy-D-gluconate 5-dehydrogenase KduD n=1 Tax=Acidaminobacter sp. JC074 TaxID=2530199 RepID=UPI0021061B81|nr:2-dehydro-3-deoxy-D-gluconate 5-dehydrogenase KduD [Acidaminobacter sp. JC074]MCH4886995.1 2-dehydro-3-deoxy-D-gluconate 5-dehydrogenase KduD [Acidaminobacter sp. JC074]